METIKLLFDDNTELHVSSGKEGIFLWANDKDRQSDVMANPSPQQVRELIDALSQALASGDEK